MLNISQFYLANIENDHKIPSLPIIIQLINIFALPAEKYFNQPLIGSESEQRQRIGQKVKICPEEYLPIIEGALGGALERTYVETAR